MRPGVSADQITCFDVIDETGQAVGMVMSKGWDELARNNGASMLESTFDVLQKSTDYTV